MINKVFISMFFIFVGTIGIYLFFGPAKIQTENRSKDPPSGFFTSSITFKGDPKGGTVELFVVNTTIEITTSPNESIAQVAKKVSDTLNTNKQLQQQSIKAKINDDSIILTNVSEYQLSVCTTDKGLAVSQAPQEFSCKPRTNSRTIDFHWHNPLGSYDRIHIVDSSIPLAENLDSATTTFTYDYSSGPSAFFYHGRHIYRILGVKEGVPSCSAVCEADL